MKVKVAAVKDTSFDGNDGKKVGAVDLTFEADGTTKTRVSYIPLVVAAVLKWQAGEEHEIEEYQDKKGKTRFKIPGMEQGRKGNQLSFDERLALDKFQQQQMNKRTSLMQAVVVYAGTDLHYTLEVADVFYDWLQDVAGGGGNVDDARVMGKDASGSTAPPPATNVGAGSPDARGISDTAPAPATEEGEPPVGESNPPGSSSSAPSDPVEKCNHEWQPAPRRGFEVCAKCRVARKNDVVLT
jgi:hypothetical protein